MERSSKSIRRGYMRASSSTSIVFIRPDKIAYLCRRYHPTKGPEARLYSACLAALLFPAGMFIYAWCTFPDVPWIGMAMGVFVSVYSSIDGTTPV